MAKRANSLENKIKFGFSNVHYVPMTKDSKQGAPKWDIAVRGIPGAVTFTAAPQTTDTPFYADNVLYYQVITSNGFEGDLTMAQFPDEFLKDVIGSIEDDNGAILTTGNAEQTQFALMGQTEGNADPIRFVFYCCTATQPEEDYETKADTTVVKTQVSTITAIPYDLGIKDGNGNELTISKASIRRSVNPEAYDSFFEQVYMPVIGLAGGGLI